VSGGSGTGAGGDAAGAAGAAGATGTAGPAGTLWLVPNTLDLGAATVALDEVLPRGVMQRAAALTHWVVEDARSARAFLKRVQSIVPLAQPLQALHMVELPRPAKGRAALPAEPGWAALLAPALAGFDLGLLSEAGLPAVADPGAPLVAAAHAAGVPVRALPGPCSLTLALAASGLGGQHFAFVGYLPQDAAARAARLQELESTSRRLAQTQLVIETPYRNGALFAALLATLAPATRLTVALGLTLPEGWTRTARIEQWRKAPPVLPDRIPAVFGFLA
jgi:16S rRNA (cytidine1402-2'-O)-methyltransferase